MQNNTAKLITLDDDAGFRLIYKKDITADTDGATSYDSVIRQALKGDEYQKDFDEIFNRCSESQVQDVQKALEELKNNKLLVDHLHIPLQSGCDKTLREMNRKYDINYFKNCL